MSKKEFKKWLRKRSRDASEILYQVGGVAGSAALAAVAEVYGPSVLAKLAVLSKR